MTFAGDGWICRSCWNSNRQHDERCYRCKAPRGADDATVQEHRAKREANRAKETAVSGVVTTIPSFVMRWYARVLLAIGVIPLAVVALLAVALGGLRGGQVVALGVVVAGQIVIWLVFRWAAGAMQDGNRLAFLITAVISWAVVASVLTGLAAIPQGLEIDAIGWVLVWLFNVMVVAFALSGLLATLGLVLRLIPKRWLPAEGR